MGWLEDLPGPIIQDSGTTVAQRGTLNFHGFDIADDQANGRVDIYATSESDWKGSVRLCPAAALPAYTRTLSAIEANAVGALPALDGSAAASGDLVLLIGVATASDVDNGIWQITSLGAAGAKWSMARAQAANETLEITPQMVVRVEEGTANANREYTCTNTGAVVINTTPIVFVADAAALAHEQSVGVYRPEKHGAVGDVQSVTDGVAVAGDATVTSATAGFVAADAGKIIRILGAAAAGADLQTTIASVTSGTTIELTVAATTSVNPATIDWCTDDGEALQDWLDDCKVNHADGQLSAKRYGILRNLGLTSATGVRVLGNGMGASTIKDMRADDLVGALTGAYQGLISFIDCVAPAVENLSLEGNVSLASTSGTANFGRQAVHFHDCDHPVVRMVEMSNFRDEASYAENDCPGWSTQFCWIHDNNSNAINVNSNATTSDGSVVLGNFCVRNRASALLLTAKSLTCMGNILSGGAALGGDLCVLDNCGSFTFSGNMVCDTIFAASTSALRIFGFEDPDSVCTISGNTFARITGTWQPATVGACIAIDDNASGHPYQPSGTVTITGNAFTRIDCLVDEANRLVRIANAASTFRCFISGNTMLGDDAGFLRIGIQTIGNDAGAEVRIGDNYMPGWVTPYDDQDGSMRFNGECRISSITVDHTTNPNPIPVGVARVLVDCSGGAVTCTMTPKANQAEREVQFLDFTRSADVNNITIEGDGAETVNGVANVVSTAAGGSINVFCLPDESGWVTTSPVS